MEAFIAGYISIILTGSIIALLLLIIATDRLADRYEKAHLSLGYDSIELERFIGDIPSLYGQAEMYVTGTPIIDCPYMQPSDAAKMNAQNNYTISRVRGNTLEEIKYVK